ncbi:uncharacterized protein LOC144433080 [Glandiceps talaboti]
MAVDEEVSITFDSPDKFYTTSKQQLLQQYQSEFKAKSSQGRVTREAGKVNHGVSSTYLNNHKIDDNLRSFVARGRLQLLQCESLMTLYYPESYTKSCKICNHPTETVSHILNGCTKFQKLYQQRHNRIVDLIFGKIANSNPGKETFKDTVLKPEMFDAHMRTFEHQHKRPDITIIDVQNKHAILVKVSVAFDAHNSLCFQKKCYWTRHPVTEKFGTQITKCRAIATTPYLCQALKVRTAPLRYVPSTLAGRPYFPGAHDSKLPTYLSQPKPNFPLVLSPENPENELSIADWSMLCKEQTDSLLHNVGALLFQGLPLCTVEDFSTFIVKMGYQSLRHKGGTRRKDKVSDEVMTARDKPLKFTIDLHTEMSNLSYWPSKVVFFCVQPPGENTGGETPIAKFDGILEELDPKLLKKLNRKGVRYYINIRDKSDSTYMSWQNIFLTEDRKEVESFCREQGYEFTWNDDNSITYHYALSPTINHPTTGEVLWFNQITSHHASIFYAHPEYMNAEREPTKYPLHTSYGDGEEFTDDEISHMRILQWNKAVGFHWQKSDVLVVDNLTTAHGRIGAMFDHSQREVIASMLM